MKSGVIALRAAVTTTALAVAVAAIAAEPLVVEPASARSNVFAGRAVTFGTVVRGGDAVEGKLVWSLTVATRAVASGAVAVRHAAADTTAVPIAIDVPDVRKGVVVDAALTVALVDAARTRLGSCTRPVRIFPDDPFAGRRQWLESREIALVDPPGRTERAFRAAGVPFTLVAADGDVAAIQAALVVVGEGTSWVEHPGLPRALARLVARGVNVLCLAPLDGSMPLPGTADEPGACVAKSLALRRADVVTEFDARLDAMDWHGMPEDGDAVAGRLTIAADGAAVVARAGDAPTGWPWLEAAFAPANTDAPAAKLVVCGFGIVAHWDETPAARYLFAALLARLTANQPDERTEQDRPQPEHPESPRAEPSQEEDR
jgi:hypothetical protein